MTCYKRQPHQVIGETRAHAAATLRMPPVLHIPFFELTAGTPYDVLARQCGLCVCKRHDVLQLVPKPEGAARLVQCRACPHAARQRLIECPLIQDEIESRVRRIHTDLAKTRAPRVRCFIESRSRPVRITIPREQRRYRFGTLSRTEEKYNVTALTRCE